MEACNRVDLVNRRIGPVRGHKPSLGQRIEDITTLPRSLVSQAINHPGTVRTGKDALHGGNHTKINRPLDIIRVNDLRVLDAPAQVGLIGIPLHLCFINIQQLPVGAVTDPLNCQLVIVFHRQACRGFDFLDRHDVETTAARQIRIGLQQPATVRAEGAIEYLLANRSNGQKVIAMADHAIVVEAAFHIGGLLFKRHP